LVARVAMCQRKMPFFYEVRDTRDPEPAYPCGPWIDGEEAIMHFNRVYGPAVGERLTTLPAGTSCSDYILIEQARPGQFGLRDVRSIPLYRSRAP
jgi:hypothetical protein